MRLPLITKIFCLVLLVSCDGSTENISKHTTSKDILAFQKKQNCIPSRL